ncbi:MAG: hypothetical protein V1792_04240 [Pseudomonadota bacterium]
MADYYLNVPIDEEREKKLQEVGLAGEIQEQGGRKVIQVPLGKKDFKKLCKGFSDLEADESNTCSLPSQGDQQLFDLVVQHKATDIMKIAITKLYNPLAGKELRSKLT